MYGDCNAWLKDEHGYSRRHSNIVQQAEVQWLARLNHTAGSVWGPRQTPALPLLKRN